MAKDSEPGNWIDPHQLVESKSLSGYAGFTILEPCAAGAADGASVTGTMRAAGDLPRAITAGKQQWEVTREPAGQIRSRCRRVA